MSDYPHIIGRVFNRPLCIHPVKAATILRVLQPQLRLDPQCVSRMFEVQPADAMLPAFDGVGMPVSTNVAALDPSVEMTFTTLDRPREGAFVPGRVETTKPYAVTDRGVAVISVNGTLVHRAAAQMRPMSGMTSYGDLEAKFADAMGDQTVRGILLDIDSGGGEVNGAFDFSDVIHRASQENTKPIWAVADEFAFSAAYALASAAQRVIVPRTGGVGSVGVIAMHLDVSDRDRMEGLRFTTIFAGARKNDLNPHERLSDEAIERIQGDVDATYDLFVSAVARNRRMTEAAVRQTEADTYRGLEGEATAIGFADEVLPFREALAEFTEMLDRGPSTRLIRANAAATSTTSEETTMPDENTNTATPGQQAGQADASPAAAAANEQSASADVVDLDAARAEGRNEAATIAELCTLAGRPELAAEFISEKLTEQAVRARLLEVRAAADSASTDAATTGAGAAAVDPQRLNANTIYRRRNEMVRNVGKASR